MTREALGRLEDAGERLWTSEQNLVEFWNVATRPVDVNGLGLAPRLAAQTLRRLESALGRLKAPRKTFEIWRDLVTGLQVRGSKVHDARLVAVMLGSGIFDVLTFDLKDFRRYQSYGIRAVSPEEVMNDTD